MSIFSFSLRDIGFVLFCWEVCSLQKSDQIWGYHAAGNKIYRKKNRKNALNFKNIFCIGYNFDKNGSYYCRVLNSEQNKTNPMSLYQKMREELSMGGSSKVGGFLRVGVNGGDSKKKSLSKKTPFL